MHLSPELLELLACPGCEAGLEPDSNGLICARCAAVFPVVEGIPVLLLSQKNPHREAEAAQWDDQAETYETERVQDPQYMAGVDCAVELLAPRPGGWTLDAGCGTGLTVRSFHTPAHRTLGLDLSLQSLLQLRRRMSGAEGLHLVCGDLAALPLRPGRFSRVLSANTLQHLPDASLRDKVLFHLARVAAPGATVVVSAHHYSRPKRRAGWEREGPAGGQSGEVQWIHRFEHDEFHDLMARHLTVTRIYGAGFPLPYRFKLSPVMRRVERWARTRGTWLDWAHMLVGVGRTPESRS